MQVLLKPVAQDLAALEPLLVEYLLTPNEPTNQVLRHIFQSGGKRVRPALFLLTAQALGYRKEHLYPIASVCEYIHTASLLHDDVIDSSTVRRGKPTANSIWGDETAVLAGDLIYSAACRLMVKTQSLPLIDTFAECIRFMSESELFQLELLWKKDTTLTQYERVVAGKTAALFEASTKTPCYLVDSDPEVTEAFGEYGRCLGFAFQIADDCLDYEGTSEALGKAAVADLKDGKVTLPVIFGLQKAGEHSALAQLVAALLESGEATPAQIQQLVEDVRLSGGLHEAKSLAQSYASKARIALQNALQKGNVISTGNAAAESLMALLEFVIERKN
jgi:geranylgeranyl pyrophosphate synthase